MTGSGRNGQPRIRDEVMKIRELWRRHEGGEISREEMEEELRKLRRPPLFSKFEDEERR